MKKYLLGLSIAIYLFSCGGNAPAEKETIKTRASEETQEDTRPKVEKKAENGNPSYDPKRGEGKFSDDNVKVGEKLDEAMATAGDKVQGVKCSSCHKMTDERLVGPGWKDVTKRRTAPWLMNFITDPGPMIDKDPAVQAQLELCLVRMPNQSLTDEEARQILEFMRKNDGVK